ncbi:GGDEF domain-containing protein [Sphingopyxis sp.]|uniref:GGDEF domain-containing protein n=1 Tax=Sphingopyxis sp. TaxID=1908224 RepID=UPI0035B1D731
MDIVRTFPDMEVTPQWFKAGALCAAVISTPVCIFLNLQGRRIAELHAQLSEAYLELEQRASIDQMTGLSNRESFLATINLHAERGWLIVGDLDHFKQINDRHGHVIGDKVLEKVGEAIRQCVREEDICARLGGEEFGIFLPKASRKTAESIAERVRSAIADLSIRTRAGELVTPTISIGASRREAAGLRDLIERADNAMYQAKHKGRNQVVFAEARSSA